MAKTFKVQRYDKNVGDWVHVGTCDSKDEAQELIASMKQIMPKFPYRIA